MNATSKPGPNSYFIYLYLYSILPADGTQSRSQVQADKYNFKQLKAFKTV